MLKKARPSLLESTTQKFRTGCGGLFVTIGYVEKHPIEVFAILGKAGGCSSCQNEALGRAISIGLKYGVPIEDYIEELHDIRCPQPHMFPKEERCLSCADGISQGLKLYTNGRKVS